MSEIDLALMSRLRVKRMKGLASEEEIIKHKKLQAAAMRLRRADPILVEKIRQTNKNSATRNKDKYNTTRRVARQNSPELRAQNAERCAKRYRSLTGEQKQLRIESCKKWLREHPEYERSPKRMKSRRDRKRHRIATDPIFRMIYNLRSRCSRSIKRGTKQSSLKQYLGCTIAELKVHIESLWLPGMSWDNYTSKGWHIDHKRPLASFDLSDSTQFAIAFHYTNLQPLWWIDNLRKGSHV